MALVLEDGTGKSDATSYVSVLELKAYWDTFGYDYSGFADDAAIEVELNKATRVVDAYHRWEGRRVDREQGLQWPRYDYWTPDDYLIPSNEIPQALKDAVCEAAYAAHTGTVLQPINDRSGNIKRYKFRAEGAVEEETEYFEGSSDERNQVVAIEDALLSLIGNVSSYGNMKVKRV